jgi:hypothetical protein
MSQTNCFTVDKKYLLFEIAYANPFLGLSVCLHPLFIGSVQFHPRCQQHASLLKTTLGRTAKVTNARTV